MKRKRENEEPMSIALGVEKIDILIDALNLWRRGVHDVAEIELANELMRDLVTMVTWTLKVD